MASANTTAVLGLPSQYEIEKQYHHTGWAQVYRALDRSTGQRVVIKALDPSRGDCWYVDRLRLEISWTIRVGKGVMPKVVASVDNHLCVALITEYLGAQNVKEWIDGRPCDMRVGLAMAREMARCLESIHRHVVHRDVKPSNFVINCFGRPVLIDLGLVHSLRDGRQLTLHGQILGTADYFSPEQALGHDIDIRTDVYAFGVTLFEMFTGGKLFPGEVNMVRLGMRHIEESPRNLRAVRPEAPQALDDLIAWCLQKQRENRPPSMRAVLEAVVAVDTALERPGLAETSLQQLMSYSWWGRVRLAVSSRLAS
jgi:serine/threonine protein kinase